MTKYSQKEQANRLETQKHHNGIRIQQTESNTKKQVKNPQPITRI